MRQRFRIRVYGTQRKNIDPALLAQVVILLGRHLQQRQHTSHQNTTHPKPRKDPSAPLHRGNPGPGASAEHRSRTPENDTDHRAGDGAGELS